MPSGRSREGCVPVGQQPVATPVLFSEYPNLGLGMSGVAASPGWQAGVCILISHLEDPTSGALILWWGRRLVTVRVWYPFPVKPSWFW